MKSRDCVGCIWEHNYKKCPNDYKKDMPKHKDGTLQCDHCMWKKPASWYRAELLRKALLEFSNKKEWNEFKTTLLYKKFRKYKEEIRK